MTVHTAWLRWPRSLFGRLMAVLCAGLVAVQLLSAWINVDERDRLMRHHAGLQPAQRVADAVRLLDSLEPAERQRIALLLDVPPRHVRLFDDPPPPLPDTPVSQHHPVQSYTQALRLALGDDRAVRVAGYLIPARSGRPNRRPRPDGPSDDSDRMRPPAGLPVLSAQVQLRDGHWVMFDTHLPDDTVTPPIRLLLSLALGSLAVLGLSYVAVRWVTQPLRVLAQAAEALGKNIHHPPLAEQGPDELRRAAQAFNTMQRRLARFIEDRTRMLTAMSHDLKTPLTRLRLRTELLDDEVLRERFEHDLLEMEQMVTDALEFMRGLEPSRSMHQPVDLNALLESLQADQQAMGREVSLAGQAHAPWLGDAARLRRCLGNLIDNAVRYGQRAQVQIDDGPHALRIAVSDSGPGIPEPQLEQVFEPFYRLEASRGRDTGGTGLGLGIARNIARAAGGDVVLHNIPGGGLQAVVTLPR